MSDIKKVLTATDRSTKAIVKATSDLSNVMASLGLCVTTSEKLITDIEFKQSELDALEGKMAYEERLAKADLDLRVTENEDRVLTELLRKRKMASILVTEVDDLSASLETAKEDNSEVIDKAVSTAEALLHARYGGEKKSLQSEHLVAMAQKDADNNSLNQKVEFMQQTIEGLQETIKAEREARIAMAESASKASGVVVNTSGK